MHPRSDAMINGALIAVGTLGILDNVVIHWLLKLHRAISGEHALAVELALVVISVALLLTGIWRERRARQKKP